MRILAIRGQNLASLADAFAIDFTAEPLAGSGIFAITGPTGAGKSTLLDAVCLALFNEIPRLKAAPASGRIGGEDEDNAISLRDTRAILRHGAGEGFAEVDFVMPNGAQYRARWSVKRARGRADGRLQNYEHSFDRLDQPQRLGGTRKETLAEIRAVIGLSAEQFGRAVLLAQGDFEAFIRADANDRAVLLERLTGSEIYTTLGQRAFDKSKGLQDELDQLRAAIAGQNGLDETGRKDAEAALEAALQAERETTAKLDALKVLRQREEHAAQLALQASAARDTLTAAEAAQAAAAPRRDALTRSRRALALAPVWAELSVAQQRRDTCSADRTRIIKTLATAREDEEKAARAETEAIAARNAAKAEATALAPALDQARALDVQLRGAEATLAKAALDSTLAEEVRTRAATADAAATAALTHAEAALATARQWIADHQPLAALADREEELSAELRDHATATQALVQAETTRPEREQALLEAMNAHAQADAAFCAATQHHAAAAQALADTQKALPPPDALNALTERHTRLTRIETLLAGATGAQDALALAEAALTRTRQALRDAAATRTPLAARHAALTPAIPALATRVSDARRQLDLLRNAASDAAEAMRATLTDGEPCPVCGSDAHRLGLFEGKLGEHLRQHQIALKALETNHAALDHEAVDIAAKLAALDERTAHLGREQIEQVRHFDTALRRRDEAQAILLAAMADSGLPQDFAVLPDALRDARRTAEADLLAHGVAQKAAEAARQHELKARARLDTAREAQASAREALETGRRALEDLDKAIADYRAELESTFAVLDRWLAPAGDWRTLSDPGAWLTAQAAQWRLHEADAARLAQDLPPLQQACATASEALRHCTTQAQGRAAALSTATADHRALTAARAALLDGDAVAAVEHRLAARRSAAEQARAHAATLREAAAKAHAAAAASEVGAVKALVEAENDAARRAAAFATALKEADLTAETVIEAASTGAEVLDREAQALDAIDHATAMARAVLAERERDMAAHAAADPPALTGDALTANLEEATAACAQATRARTEVEVRLHHDDLVRNQTAQLRAQLESKTADADVWLRLAALIGDRTGATFRRFAQSLTLDRLLEHANTRLAELKPRYMLDRVPGGDMLIQVVDNDMGGEARGLHNLSGGERFLVSLALALGLAEMSTAGGVKIESLFIDEGFGALDPASLGQALALLEHLHATGRRVGVISHVEELKERIPAKIEVTPTGRGTSRVEIVGT